MENELVPYYFAGVVTLVTLVMLAALNMVRKALANQKWNLSDALSEKSTSQPAPAPGGGPAAGPVMVASSSRMTALVGSIVITAMYVGVGYYALYAVFFDRDGLSVLPDIIKYFLTGSALFAPYAFNKLSSIGK